MGRVNDSYLFVLETYLKQLKYLRVHHRITSTSTFHLFQRKTAASKRKRTKTSHTLQAAESATTVSFSTYFIIMIECPEKYLLFVERTAEVLGRCE